MSFCRQIRRGTKIVHFRTKNTIMTELLTKETFLKKVFNFEENKEWKFEGDKPCVIDFYADWCGPCKMLAPILKEVKSELGDAIKIIKIDVDKNQNLATKYQVRGVPTMLLFKNGKQVWRQSGVLQKDDIVNIINQN